MVLVLFPASAWADSADSAAAPSPVPPIERLNTTLIDIMQRADELGYDGRYDAVAPVVGETFDLEFMASKSIGPYWGRIAAPQRVRWIEAFTRYTVSNFAGRFDGFSGQSFIVVGQKPASHETVLVMTQLIRPTGNDVELNYRMRMRMRKPAKATADGDPAPGDGAWQVVDIYSGGKVSEIALRRSEYVSVLKQGGIEELIRVVNAKAESRAQARK